MIQGGGFAVLTEPIGTPGRFVITAAGGAGRGWALDGWGGNQRATGLAAEFGRRARIPTGLGGRRAGLPPGSRDGNAAAGGGVFAVWVGRDFTLDSPLVWGDAVDWECQVSVLSGLVVSGGVKWLIDFPVPPEF